MVLTSADLGGAKVTGQRYYKDADFPSVISYVREFEEGAYRGIRLPYVDSEAGLGTSVATTTQFLVLLRRFFASKEARKLIVETLLDELGSDALISNVQVGRPRNLGVGPGSFDILVTARLLGLRVEFHTAVFRVERVLGLVTAVGGLGRRVPVSAMTGLARIMAARMRLELATRNTTPPTIAGTPMVGQTLTATSDAWSPTPTRFAYVWQRCNAAGAACSSIPGATAKTYVVIESDVGSTLRVAVTAHTTVGSATATSAPTAVVAVFVDTFSGDSVDRFWFLSIEGAGPRVVQANGQLEVTFPAGTSLGPQGYANAAIFMSCRFPGDFDMQVEYRLLSGPLPPGVNVGFDAAEFTGNAYAGQHGMFVWNPGVGSQRITTHFPHPGEFGLPYNDFVPDTARSGTLRLVRRTAGGVTTVTASRLGLNPWSFTSQPYTPPTSQAANLNVFTNQTPFTTEVRVAYDNFRISSGAISC